MRALPPQKKGTQDAQIYFNCSVARNTRRAAAAAAAAKAIVDDAVYPSRFIVFCR